MTPENPKTALEKLEELRIDMSLAEAHNADHPVHHYLRLCGRSLDSIIAALKAEQEAERPEMIYAEGVADGCALGDTKLRAEMEALRNTWADTIKINGWHPEFRKAMSSCHGDVGRLLDRHPISDEKQGEG